MEELRRENQSLRAQIQGLQYENRMYKQLLDNLFLGGNGDEQGISARYVNLIVFIFEKKKFINRRSGD